MLYEHIMSMPWWPSSHLYGNHSIGGGTPVGLYARNISGLLFKNGEQLISPTISNCGITAEWNLDFEQTLWGQRERFQVENIRIIKNNNSGGDIENEERPYTLLFASNPDWLFTPATNKKCVNATLSLRIGGCLVEIWHLRDTLLKYASKNGDIVYSLNYGSAKSENYRPKIRIALLGFSNILFQVCLSPDTSRNKQMLQCEMPQKPFVIHNSDQYKKDPRQLLLDWYRQNGTIQGFA